MTQPLTENSPAVRLYAAFDRATKESVASMLNANDDAREDAIKIAAEHERLVAERTAELEARVKVLEKALTRIQEATPGNTNSHTAASAFSWCKAVAATALDNPDG